FTVVPQDCRARWQRRPCCLDADGVAGDVARVEAAAAQALGNVAARGEVEVGAVVEADEPPLGDHAVLQAHAGVRAVAAERVDLLAAAHEHRESAGDLDAVRLAVAQLAEPGDGLARDPSLPGYATLAVSCGQGRVARCPGCLRGRRGRPSRAGGPPRRGR